MRRRNKFKYFLKIFLTRGILSGIGATIVLILQNGTSLHLTYHGLGNIAGILVISIPTFLLTTFSLYIIEGFIIPTIGEGISSILIVVLCAIVVGFRNYAMGHLFDIIPMGIFFFSFATLAAILERLWGLRREGDFR